IGIVSRPHIKGRVDIAREIIENFPEEEIVLAQNLAEEIGGDGVLIDEMEVDALITIGGDGTVLYSLQKIPETPMLGINMGGRGFLADVDPEEA
ncbi:MAG: NAD(+)/NADH kinase, partial [Candidatus Aenigmatarchaeota archaeon]